MLDIKNFINEVSINAKKRNERMIKGFLNGKENKNIVSLGIITAQNPSSQQASNSYNKKANKDLMQYIKQNHMITVPVKGHFGGNNEDSFAIVNATVEQLKTLGYKYDQTSFFYIIRDGKKFEAEYYEKSDNDKPADKVNNEYEFINNTSLKQDGEDSDGNYTLIGKDYKFTFDSEVFSKVNKQIGEGLTQASVKYNITIDEAFDFANLRTGQKAAVIRKIVYENN